MQGQPDAVLAAEELLRTPYRNVQLTARIVALLVASGLSQHEVLTALSAVHTIVPALLPLTLSSDQQDEGRPEGRPGD